MSKRKPLSNKTRFEVFKRDSFTCQYCGGKAPDIVLNVDHIKPVAKDGDNDIMNLITSCFECNNGKSDRELNDDAVVTKQRDQLEQLNERKQQLEMMMRWRDELDNFDDEKVASLQEYIQNKFDVLINESAEEDLRIWVKKYDFNILLDAVDISYENYRNKIFTFAFNKIARIAHYIVNPLEEDVKRMYYVRGILRNKIRYLDEAMALERIKQAHYKGVRVSDMELLAKTSNSWMDFSQELEWLERE